jgi:formylglycine-generating enzyme required for sulfatase activity
MPLPPFDMARVPPGSITLRDARTTTARQVDLCGFSIARTPVTWGLYATLRSEPVPDDHPATTPVHSVSWFEAVAWCNRASEAHGLAPAYGVDGTTVAWDVGSAGFRLPTEAEWEWACRAGTSGPRYGPLAEVAWTEADSVDGPQPVGSKRPNDLGLSDMLGNVWEWCWDYMDTARYADYRTLRGGGWADQHWSVRASVRRGSLPSTRLDDVGFRLAQGAVGHTADQRAQGWSHQADQQRADLPGPVPPGWTPLRSQMATPRDADPNDLPQACMSTKRE